MSLPGKTNNQTNKKKDMGNIEKKLRYIKN